MKSNRINKFFISILSLFLLAGTAWSVETFQNSLVKMDFYETSTGGVKVNLYTSKPYKDAIRVNKKSDVEYAILMPETSNSMSVKPALKSASNAVKSVDVKTQQYANQFKGYTKIVISTTRSVDIVPVVQTLSIPQPKAKSNLASKNIVAKSENKQSIAKNNATPQSIKTQLKNEINKSAQKISRAQARVKPPVFVQKTIQKVMPKSETVKNKEISQNLPTKLSNAKGSTLKVVTKVQQPVKVQKKEQVSPVQKLEQPKVQPELAVTKSIKTEVQQKTPETAQNLDTENPETASASEKVATPQELGFIPKLKQEFNILINKIMSISNNIYLWAGIILIPLILLLLIFKGLGQNAKRMKQQKADFMAHLNDAPIKATDYTENINEDMGWQEKFETYVNTPSSQQENVDDNVVSDELVDEDMFSAPIETEIDDLYDNSLKSSVEGSTTEEFMEEIKQEVDQIPEIDDLSSMSEEISISNNNYEEDSVLDELSQMMSQDESEDEEISVEDLFGEDETTFEEPEDENIEEENIYQEAEDLSVLDELAGDQDVPEVQDFQEEILPEFVQEPIAESITEPIVETPLPAAVPVLAIENVAEEVADDAEGEIVKSEYSIDDEKGFYLVDFDDSTALVGHIADEVFVLKKFDTKIDGKIQARVDEEKGSSTNYMTRVGKFKALVEVTSNKMNLLIEL